MAITLGLGCEVTSAEKAAVVDGWMARRSGASENTRYARKRDKAPETLRPAVERITPVSVVPRENGGISTVLQATSHRPATQKTLSLPTQPQPPGPLFEDKINPETPLLGRLGLHFASKRLISTAKIETAYLCSRSARLSRWRRVFGSRRCLDRCRRIPEEGSRPHPPPESKSRRAFHHPHVVGVSRRQKTIAIRPNGQPQVRTDPSLPHTRRATTA